MNELLLFFGGAVGIIIVGFILYFIEKFGNCWHKWGFWIDETTDDAYAQYRICLKCGYIEREQWKKIKGTTT